MDEAQQEILALIMALGNDADGFAKLWSLFLPLMDGELCSLHTGCRLHRKSFMPLTWPLPRPSTMYELNFKNST